MPRRPRDILTAACAMLFRIVAALSVRAPYASDLVTVSVDHSKPPVFVRNQVQCFAVDWGTTSFRQRGLVKYRWQPVNRSARRIDTGYAIYSLPGVYYFGDRIFVAHWLISLVTFPMPLLALFRWVGRSKRYAAGQCVACGYDLRASGDRCPECGMPASSTVAAPMPG